MRKQVLSTLLTLWIALSGLPMQAAARAFLDIPQTAVQKVPSADEKPSSEEAAARIDGTLYQSLSDAVQAANPGDTITLLKAVHDGGALHLPANVTLDGAGNTISGKTTLSIDAAGAIIQNIVFQHISSNTEPSSAIDAPDLEGEVMISGCSFQDGGETSIQITPLDGASIIITQNTFTADNRDMVQTSCYVAIQSEWDVDFAAIVTENRMYDELRGADVAGKNCAALQVSYFLDPSRIQVSENFIEDPTGCRILSGIGYNEGERLYPLYADDQLINLAPKPAVCIKNGWDGVYFVTLKEAIEAARPDDRIILLQDCHAEIDYAASFVITSNGWVCDIHPAAGYQDHNEDANGYDIQPIPLTGIHLDQSTVFLYSNQAPYTETLTVTRTPVDAVSYPIVWSSDHEEVATVVDGVITAKSSGTAVITATANGVSAMCQVTVSTYMPPSADGGSSFPAPKPEITVTPDGTITETVHQIDGTTLQIIRDPAGNQATVVTKQDGSTVTSVRLADGTMGSVAADQHGSVIQAEAKIFEAAAHKATRENTAVLLPIQIPVAASSEQAPLVQIHVPDGGVKVKVPLKNATFGTVPVILHADGTEELVKKSIIAEDGVILRLEHSTTLKIVDNTKIFEDVPMTHWAKAAIDFVTARDIFTGSTEQTFSPMEQTTRGQLVTALASLDGMDTSTATMQDRIAWAVARGITDGSAPDEAISRQQLVTMLWRYIGMHPSRYIPDHPDAFSIASYAQPALAWALENKIISGYTDGLLRPQASASRAHVAVMLLRYCVTAL